MSGVKFEDLWAGPVSLPPLRQDSLPDFQRLLYGPVPPPPERIEVRKFPLPGCERLEIAVSSGSGSFTSDAALWRAVNETAPLIVGLDFTGPVGVLSDNTFPIDGRARVFTREHGDRLTDAVRGIHAYRWPVERLLRDGFAVLVACYGSWAPDEPVEIDKYGLRPILGDTGAISLWAWALMRLIDAAEQFLRPAQVIAVGHSRLGKAALWAGAHDRRIGTVFANNAGAGGTAPAGHRIGETLAEMAKAYPHWIRPQRDKLPVDQHQLMARLAPRRLYVASAEEDAWADPLGTYEALRAASQAWPVPPVWPEARRMWEGTRVLHHSHLGHHVRPGGHDLTGADWDLFLDWFRRSG